LNKNAEHTINHREQARLNGYAPKTVMTGLQAKNPLEEIFRCPEKEAFSSVAMDNRTIGCLVEEMQTALTNMHKIVNAATNNQRQKKKEMPNQKRKLPNFSLGD
jgi:hypothetical protein